MGHNNTHESTKMAGIVVASAAVGAAVAMIISPKSGRGMREKVAETMSHAKDKVEEIAEKSENPTMPK